MKQVRVTFVLIVFWGMLAPQALQAQQMHSFSIHDMLAMDRISDPQVSPDGKTIAFVLRKTDLAANKGRTDLWLVSTDGSGLKQFTTDPASDTSPRWSSDGTNVYFISTRSGSAQVWEIAASGGAAKQVTHQPLDLGNLKISPDGKHLAFTMEVFPDCENLSCTTRRIEAEKNHKTSGVLYEKLFVRHWDTWKDGRRSHVFVMPAAGGDAIDIMKGMDADSPSKPFGGPGEITFTPDGQAVVFTARDAGREEAWSTDFDLYLAPIDGVKEPECLTETNDAWDTSPTFSPDGKTLAYLAMQRPGYESDRFRVMLRGWPDGKTRILTEEWDRSPGSILWSPNSKTIFTVAADLGQRSLFAIKLNSGEVKTLWKEGRVRSPAMAGKRIVFGLDNLKSPVELYSIKSNGKDLRTITKINAEKLAAARMGDYEQFAFKGWNDETVSCYVVKPADFDPNKKYPVAFLIHGGPQGSFGNDFHYRWNPQAYAGAGYAAVMVDFHGSVGYGQEFTDAIRGDWGGKPLEDLQKGLAAALERYPWMDGERVGALGASYGGYMVNWIEGNWPDRFKCLVNHDGVFDQRMMYFATEELWFPEWEHGGPYYANPKGYEKHNPALHIDKWQTPMLVVHGARDYRVLLEQGIGAFTALQRRGIPSKFLYFPDENHWVLTPHNGILWHETVIGWLDQWLRDEATN